MGDNPPDYRSRLGGIMRGLLTGPRGAATMQEAFKNLGPSIANLRPPVFRCGWPAPRSRVLALRVPLPKYSRIICLRTQPATRCADRAAVRCRGPQTPLWRMVDCCGSAARRDGKQARDQSGQRQDVDAGETHPCNKNLFFLPVRLIRSQS